MMKAVCDRLEAALRTALCAIVAAMTLTVCWQVLTRLLFKLTEALKMAPWLEPSRWTEELAGFLLGWVALLGAAYALRRKEHLGLDLFYQKMSPPARRRTDRLGHGLVAVFSAVVLVYGGARLVAMTFVLRQTTPALHWPMGLVYLVIPLSGALMTLFAVEGLLGRRGADGAAGVGKEPLS